MEPEIREEIRRGTYDRPSFARVQKLLPTDDQELNGLIDELLAENAGKDFVFNVACAVGANRPVHAKCLLKGIQALVEENWLGTVCARHLLKDWLDDEKCCKKAVSYARQVLNSFRQHF
jgi:hypothetical protein